MDEMLKQQIALFRFGTIHELINLPETEKGRREALIREKCSRKWEIPGSSRTNLSRSVILSWIKQYHEGGDKLESLYPKQRSDKGEIKAIDADTALSLINLKKLYPKASLDILIKKAQQEKQIPADFKASRATIYRLFAQAGTKIDKPQLQDRRKFEAEYPNDIWQSDCLHGPKVEINGKLRKSYLFAFLDDMSRLVPHAEFFLSEGINSYIKVLLKALKKRGLPKKLYVDNGSAFRSHQLSYGCARLGIALIHSRPYQPQGRGKIERFFKTVRTRFLSLCPDGLSLEELNRRLEDWVENQYHKDIHSGTGTSPVNRYFKYIHLIKEAPDKLSDCFRDRALRTVGNDRTVSLKGNLYEAPIALIGKQATLLFNEDDPARIEICYKNISYGFLVPVDVNVNCRITRDNGVIDIIPNNNKNNIAGNQADTEKTENPYTGGKLFNKNHEEKKP